MKKFTNSIFWSYAAFFVGAICIINAFWLFSIGMEIFGVISFAYGFWLSYFNLIKILKGL